MKRPPCSNWNGERCTLDLFGGRPSPGVCDACDDYAGPPRGLGDRIERVLAATGIAAAVKATTGGGCGCSRRRTALNRLSRGDSVE